MKVFEERKALKNFIMSIELSVGSCPRDFLEIYAQIIFEMLKFGLDIQPQAA